MCIRDRVSSVRVNQGLDTTTAEEDAPTDWETQRSIVRTIDVSFSEPVIGLSPDNIVLTSLGVDATEATRIPLASGQLIQGDQQLSIVLFDGDVPDGILQLEILPEVTDVAGNQLDGDGDRLAGGSFLLVGDARNRLYQLAGDFNADRIVNSEDTAAVSVSYTHLTLPTICSV